MVRRRKSPRNAPLNRSDTWQLYTLLIPAAALILVFSYIPLYGIVIALRFRITSRGIRFCRWRTSNGWG